MRAVCGVVEESRAYFGVFVGAVLGEKWAFPGCVHSPRECGLCQVPPVGHTLRRVVREHRVGAAGRIWGPRLCPGTLQAGQHGAVSGVP